MEVDWKEPRAEIIKRFFILYLWKNIHLLSRILYISISFSILLFFTFILILIGII